MKTRSTISNYLLLILFIFSFSLVHAQPPFGPGMSGSPPPNPPSEDKKISDKYATVPPTIIPLCNCDPGTVPSGTYIPGGSGGPISACLVQQIENTGNDIQPIASTNYIAQAMVWDGDCPAFSLIVSQDPYTLASVHASFLVELNGRNYGTVRDPDIIISQQQAVGGEISIIIVYELFDAGVTKIAYEQWIYNYNSNQIRMAPFIIDPITMLPDNSISGSGASHPNIDANINNEVVVVFEENNVIHTIVDNISNVTDLTGGSKPLTCTNNASTPDVSISDDAGSNSVASFVFVQNSTVFLVQDIFSSLSSTPNCTLISVAPGYQNPRISSPTIMDRSSQPNAKYECAITAGDVQQRNIAVFHNRGGAMTPPILLNFDPVSSNYLSNCNNFKPSITFTGGTSIVAVAWTYHDCT